MGTHTATAPRVVLSTTGRQAHLLAADGLTACGRTVASEVGALGSEQAIVNQPGRTYRADVTCRTCGRRVTADQRKRAFA